MRQQQQQLDSSRHAAGSARCWAGTHADYVKRPLGSRLPGCASLARCPASRRPPSSPARHLGQVELPKLCQQGRKLQGVGLCLHRRFQRALAAHERERAGFDRHGRGATPRAQASFLCTATDLHSLSAAAAQSLSGRFGTGGGQTAAQFLRVIGGPRAPFNRALAALSFKHCFEVAPAASLPDRRLAAAPPSLLLPAGCMQR